MAGNDLSASAVIHAPAADLYAIIADYERGHPRILPKPPFVSLAVEEGGIGAGTVIRVHMRVLPRGGTRPATQPPAEDTDAAQDDAQGEG